MYIYTVCVFPFFDQWDIQLVPHTSDSTSADEAGGATLALDHGSTFTGALHTCSTGVVPLLILLRGAFSLFGACCIYNIVYIYCIYSFFQNNMYSPKTRRVGSLYLISIVLSFFLVIFIFIYSFI